MTSAAHFSLPLAILSRFRAVLARRLRFLPVLPAAALAVSVTTGASAAEVWRGDFETGDLSQWSATLNERNISVVTSPVLQGTRAGQIKLTNDSTWPGNGIKRVELNHKPAAARTAEGAETYFAWSFYLPEALAADPPTQIGYWESDQTWNQVMSFEVTGQRISFATRKPQNKVHWQADNAVTPGVWHRIALRIKWSKNAAQGSVDVWFDGEQVVTGASAQTLADDNPHFTQLGLLRNPSEFTDSPILIIDDAVEGDSLEDVRPALPTEGSGGAGGAGGADGTGGSGDAGGGGAGGSSGETGGAGGAGGGGSSGEAGGAGGVGGSSGETGGGTPTTTAASTGAGGEAPPKDADSDGGCSIGASPAAPAAPAALTGLLVALAFARRRERR